MPVASVRRNASDRIAHFKESVIREMTRLAIAHNAVNLAQGFPDFAAPEEVKAAAQQAIADDINQYTITWGSRPFRQAISDYYRRFYAVDLNPETEITVCCGATEGMVAAMLALLNPGDEIVVFEPFYENYWPDSLMSGAVCRYVPLHAPDWTFDPEELRRAFNKNTRAVIVNTPNNPTGHVFSRAELTLIAELCQEYDCYLFSDEIYEHILFDGEKHIPGMTLPGMRERSVVVNSLSKTFSVTGWRVGWIVAPPELMASIRKVHDFLTVNSPAPLQQAGVTALAMPDRYFAELGRMYETKRNLLVGSLQKAGFRCFVPKGAYYILCDIGAFPFRDDVTFCKHLLEVIGVAAVPGSSFFAQGGEGNKLVRFCFAKRLETLQAAAERLDRLTG